MYISMECNRDEAVRAKEMAEQKFASQDYVSAKKLALKAQALSPNLENITQFLAVIDVHEASRKKILGTVDKDWYAILQVLPDADDEVVKKQYRKLALLLHPDKNKSVGAESAFKLIGEALQTLSDSSRRQAFDSKFRNHESGHIPSQNGNISEVIGRNSTKVFPKYARNPHPNMFCSRQDQERFCDNRFQSPSSARGSLLHPFTFWTVCSSCQTSYRYLRRLENQNLRCSQCKQNFVARDLATNLHKEPFAQRPGSQQVSAKPGSSVLRCSAQSVDKEEGPRRLDQYQKPAAMANKHNDENQIGTLNTFRNVKDRDEMLKAFDLVTIDKNEKQIKHQNEKRISEEKVRAKDEFNPTVHIDKTYGQHPHPHQRREVTHASHAETVDEERKSMAMENMQIQTTSTAKNSTEQEDTKDGVRVKNKQGNKRRALGSDSDEGLKGSDGVASDDNIKAHVRRSPRLKRNVKLTYAPDSDDDFQSFPPVKKVKVKTKIASTEASKGSGITSKSGKLAKNGRKNHRLQAGAIGAGGLTKKRVNVAAGITSIRASNGSGITSKI